MYRLPGPTHQLTVGMCRLLHLPSYISEAGWLCPVEPSEEAAERESHAMISNRQKVYTLVAVAVWQFLPGQQFVSQLFLDFCLFRHHLCLLLLWRKENKIEQHFLSGVIR